MFCTIQSVLHAVLQSVLHSVLQYVLQCTLQCTVQCTLQCTPQCMITRHWKKTPFFGSARLRRAEGLEGFEDLINLINWRGFFIGRSCIFKAMGSKIFLVVFCKSRGSALGGLASQSQGHLFFAPSGCPGGPHRNRSICGTPGLYGATRGRHARAPGKPPGYPWVAPNFRSGVCRSGTQNRGGRPGTRNRSMDYRLYCDLYYTGCTVICTIQVVL